LAERFLGGQSVGKSAACKSDATPADAGADADLAGWPGGVASGQPADHGRQPAQNGEAQPVAQKLAAAGAGIRGTSVHNSAICISIRDLEETGLPSFVQALTFLGLFSIGRILGRSSENGFVFLHVGIHESFISDSF
jgi:hypothetical protein